jgi:hypothetical protein
MESTPLGGAIVCLTALPTGMAKTGIQGLGIVGGFFACEP